MLRKLLFILILVAISLLAAWFADSPGSVNITWMGYRIETTFFFLTVIIALLVLLLAGSYLLIHALIVAPRRMKQQRREKYRKRGLEALSQAFVALASDDSATAARMLQKADKLLDTPTITLLLSAQLAKLQGDESRTRLLLQKMLKRKETSFLAARSLLQQAKSQHSTEDALSYARKMAELRPKDYQAVRALVESLIGAHQWQEALQLTEKSKRRRILKAQEAHRILAILHYNEGLRIHEEGDRASAMRFLQKAHKLQPDFIPAAILLASMQHSIGKNKDAIRTLRHCWKLAPHPDIISKLQEFYPDDTAEKWLRRVEKFTQDNPDHTESILARARAEITARQWKPARDHLKILLSREETLRICKLMAELERGESSKEEKASEWLLRASAAGPDPAWICDSCGYVSDSWQTNCPQCYDFDSLQWKSLSPKLAKEESS